MGSAKVSNAPKQQTMEEKKSIKNILAKPIRALNLALFQSKKKEKPKTNEIEHKSQIAPIDKLIENFDKLQVKKPEKDEELKNFSFKQVEDDEKELSEFSFRTVEEERKAEEGKKARTDSEDSGYSEREDFKEDNHEAIEDVLESLEKLKIEEKEDKKKKLHMVAVSRGPVKNKIGYSSTVHPYGFPETDASFRQINQVNKHTFSGGHVLVNSRTLTELTEVDVALKKVQQSTNPQPQEDLWDIVQELINEDSVINISETIENPEDILEDFINNTDLQHDYENLHNYVPNNISEVSEPNPIEEFDQLTNYEQFETLDLTSIPEDYVCNNDKICNVFPTPPRSENIPSPFSDSHSSFYPTSTPEYTLSPELSSPINSDYEKYQEIANFDDQYPSCLSEGFETSRDGSDKTPEGLDKSPEGLDKSAESKPRERNVSTSSMTMKQYKDLQKDLSQSFSKKNCCLTNRKSCKELFQERIKRLAIEERKRLCVNVSGLDVKTAYGVLHNILLSLSAGGEREDLQFALFTLICERLLAVKPELFVEELGLNLLKSAALRCPTRPLLTRYLVQCVRAALRGSTSVSGAKDCVYREIDAQGDTLLVACVRRGDACADVLSELVRREGDEVPLFNVHHSNTEGYTALHVACRLHAPAAPALHAAHVLLAHAHADLWRGDVKGEDSALHLAANSPTCDLRLVMLLFRHVDRKLWKKLAHLPNRSSVTPLEYARSAAKSTARLGYPHEVLEFLKKCR